MDLSEVFDRLASVLFPQRCLFCDEVVAYDDFWCGGCAEDGKPPYAKLGRVHCGFPHSFSDALAAIEYGGKVRELIWRLKDRPNKHILRFFAGEIRAVMAEYWNGIRFDLIVPVPSTVSKMKELGFNHSEMLARYVSRYSAIPMQGDALVRREATHVQHDLTAAERRVNAARSYDIGKPESAAGKSVLLVDDVFTTGSTVSACSDKLLEAGARRVYVVTASGTNLQNHNHH